MILDRTRAASAEYITGHQCTAAAALASSSSSSLSATTDRATTALASRHVADDTV